MAETDTTPRAVLFDVFGTLVQLDGTYSPFFTLIKGLDLATRSDRRRAIDIVLRSNLPDLSQVVHRLEDEFERTVSPDALPIAQEELARHLESALAGAAEEVLIELRERGYRLGLVTNLATVYSEPVASLGLAALVDAVVYSWEVGWVKPEPEIFAAALTALGAPAAHALMVGDSLHDDIRGAHAAGIRSLLLSDHGSPATATVPGLRGVLEYCRA